MLVLVVQDVLPEGVSQGARDGPQIRRRTRHYEPVVSAWRRILLSTKHGGDNNDGDN